MHKVCDLKVLYFGTPVVLIGSRNEDGSPNLAPMSSAWWLGDRCVLGLADTGQTSANLKREREGVLNMAPSSIAAAVDRIGLLTGNPRISDAKRGRGYRYERDKFGAAGLTEQPADLVRAPRVAECPIQLECVVEATHPLDGPDLHATAFDLRVVRAHVEDDLIIPGTHYVDPVGWDPLIMKFCEFFGGGGPVHSSRLAGGWKMPHRLGERAATAARP